MLPIMNDYLYNSFALNISDLPGVVALPNELARQVKTKSDIEDRVLVLHS